MSYFVTLLSAAETDFDEQFRYIAQRSYAGALRWEEAFEAIKSRLTQNPYQFEVAREELLHSRELRRAPFKTKSGNTYLAVFVVEDDHVTILRIRGEGQAELSEIDIPNY